MKATTKKNIKAIFGCEWDRKTLNADCTINGRLSRPIPGKLTVPGHNAHDLWVWTAQRNRASQDVHARIDLSQEDAIEQLEQKGVTVKNQNPATV